MTYLENIQKAHTLGTNPSGVSLSPYANFADLFQTQAATYGGQPYLIFREGEKRVTLNYQDFFARCCQVAQFMRHGLGLKVGARIGTVAYNHPDTVMVTYGAWLAGLVAVPFNVGDHDDRLVFSFCDAEVEAIFMMSDFTERLQKLQPQLALAKAYIQMNEGTPPEGFLSLPEALATTDEILLDQTGVNQQTPALIVYTSGTTGSPKGVLLCQQQLLVDAHAITDWYGFTPKDRAMNVLPIHHVNGLVVTLVTPLYYGGSVVLSRKFSASAYWQHTQEEGCVWGSVVPTVLSFLAESESSTPVQTPLKFLICGAGPLTIQTVERFEKAFPLKVIHGYGLSEGTCYSCYLPFDLLEEERRKWLTAYGYPSVGVPLPCNEMAIHTPQGVALGPDECGEIVIRGQNIMKEYFQRPDANAEAFVHGWFRSGDEGFYKKDNQGRTFFFITGRLKELIIRGGVNYAPLEIDEVLARIVGVKAAMAVGFDHNMYGEEVGAYVQLEKGAELTSADVLEGCKSLPFAKRPKVVVFGEDFPVTATGKYQRLKLKPLFAKWQDVQF